MAKKKAPQTPRKKSPEELKEEAFRAKCEEAAKTKAAASAPPAIPAAGGIKILRPASVPDLQKAVEAGGMKKSGSAVELAQEAKEQISQAEVASLMSDIAEATNKEGLFKPMSAPSDKVKHAAIKVFKVRPCACLGIGSWLCGFAGS